MDIKDYTWVTGKKISRPWGVEYRYTVVNSSGAYIDDIVMIESELTTEKLIGDLIVEKLRQIDVVPEPVVGPEDQRESEIEAFLVSKDLLDADQDYRDIKSKAEIIAEKV